MPSRLNQACVGGAVVGLGLVVLATAAAGDGLPSKGPGPAAWQGDLAPIAAADWSYDRAAHLLGRAGFGGTPEEIAALAAMTPQEAVAHLVDYEAIANDQPARVRAVRHPRSRPRRLPAEPAGDHRARQGDRRGARASRSSPPATGASSRWSTSSSTGCARACSRPGASPTGGPSACSTRGARSKSSMTLFWHGHFATSEDKVRDVRKMLLQNATLRRHATGNFRDLVLAVAQDPAMLYFLDAGVNVKGAPNENFAREIMELFTMGVGHYGESDIREAARAFTGWNADDLTFVVHAEQHDDALKTVLGVSDRLRRDRRHRHHPRPAGDRRVHRRQDLPRAGARGPRRPRFRRSSARCCARPATS